MAIPEDFFYSKSHEWVSFEGEVATIGITDFAQSQLSDLTFVELPEVGTTFAAGDEAAVVESVKAAADVYAPIAGEIVEINPVLEDAPETFEGPYQKKGGKSNSVMALMDKLTKELEVELQTEPPTPPNNIRPGTQTPHPTPHPFPQDFSFTQIRM